MVFDPKWYKKETRSYFNVALDRYVIAYCMDFSLPPAAIVSTVNEKVYTFPYPQPFKSMFFQNTRDPFHPYIESGMFYQPKKVTSWGDQIEKWLNAWLWHWVPFFDLFIITIDFLNWSIDLFSNMFSSPRHNFFPTMYNNLFAKETLKLGEDIWGPFKYYDLFSWAGLATWYYDSFMLSSFPLLAILLAIVRDAQNDWSILSITEMDIPIDRNLDPFGVGRGDWGFWLFIFLNIVAPFAFPLWVFLELLTRVSFYLVQNSD